MHLCDARLRLEHFGLLRKPPPCKTGICAQHGEKSCYKADYDSGSSSPALGRSLQRCFHETGHDKVPRQRRRSRGIRCALDRWQANRSERTFEVISPIDCSHIADVSAGGAEEIEAALSAARRAFPTWAALGPEGRHLILHRFGEAIQRHGKKLAALETMDKGSLLAANVHRMVPRSALNITFFADWALKLLSALPLPTLALVGREPVASDKSRNDRIPGCLQSRSLRSGRRGRR